MQSLEKDMSSVKPVELSGDYPEKKRPIAISHGMQSSFGRLPEIVFLNSIGLFCIALAFTDPMNNLTQANILYWLGLLLLILPIAFRLFSWNVSRGERFGLIVFLGLSLYLIKVMHSPFMFTFSDEFLHFRNAVNIQQSNMLFGENSILPVSAYYPGLEIFTTAFASLSGFNLFTSGLILIGTARLIIILSLFFLFEQVSTSSRVASMAVLLYMANTNFLYWSAQFSYESLSLPLASLAIFVLYKHNTHDQKHPKHGLVIFMFLLIAAIIATHHVTSYAMLVFLIVLSATYTISKNVLKVQQPGTWRITLVTGVLTLAWLFLVARLTTFYLGQIFQSAYSSLLQLFSGEETGRVLFTSASGLLAPVWERAVGITAVLLITFGILAGIYSIWKRQKLSSFSIVLSVTAFLYFGTLILRFTGGGWEVANRSSEFLFIGIAFISAFAFATFRLTYPRNPYLPYIFSVYAAIVILGGVISGWPPALRLSQPLVISAEQALIKPQGLLATSWLLDTQGPNNIIIAPPSDALLMLAYGREQALTGRIYSIGELLTQSHTLEWRTKIFQTVKARFLLVDQRTSSWDGMMGIYFPNQPSKQGTGPDLYPENIFSMFNGIPQVQRIYDSGNIVIYDIGGISNAAKTK